MSKLGERQQTIMRAIAANEGTMTKKELLKLYGGWYYCNAPKHLGDVLSRMVASQMIVRTSPGVYSLPPPKGPQIGQQHIGQKLQSGAVMPAMEEWAKAHGLI